MSNSYFQFKKFIVNQGNCAMKVCTDACLFGAWTAKEIEKTTAKNILDIGAGTGLLSLMLAQKTKAIIDAVEVDEAAAQQANDNFEASSYTNRLFIHHKSIQEFAKVQQGMNCSYDAIILNPPFFQQSLKSYDEQKNLAKHAASLTYLELATVVSEMLHPHGQFYILLPYAEFQAFLQSAIQQNLILHQQVNIRQSPIHAYFRSIGVFKKHPAENTKLTSITIRQNQQQYTEQFTGLLKDYYLNL